MKEFQADFDIDGTMCFFQFTEVVTGRERKFFVQAKLGSGPTESFEIKQNNIHGWVLIEPVPDWVLAMGQKLLRVIANNS
jgi:hypothetical protein